MAELNLDYFQRLNIDVGRGNESTDYSLTLHEQTNIDV